ncbi:predicted protein [Streptomyces iranensis]|uniref:Uncharacterized protein n=1 Tax=Streptomyces iranensis TaxID=576784 RepID=A0A061A9H8_9ACTN|nr:hypothetical protein [Streptomyces iranensis]CDR15052.1 predicted protein [Streptomyces iranensis]
MVEGLVQQFGDMVVVQRVHHRAALAGAHGRHLLLEAVGA